LLRNIANNLPLLVPPKKFLNKPGLWAVFMNEGRRVVAGEALLGGVTTAEGSQHRGQDEVLD
jgi:hypothetical protein